MSNVSPVKDDMPVMYSASCPIDAAALYSVPDI